MYVHDISISYYSVKSSEEAVRVGERVGFEAVGEKGGRRPQKASKEDQKRWTEHKQSILDSIQEADRHKDEDVKQRQVGIGFTSIDQYNL